MDPGTLSQIVRDLLSYDEARHRNVLEKYFAEDARLSHPLLTVEGTHNIRRVFRVWTSLNSQEPTIEETPVSDGKEAIVSVTQHLRPRMLPFLHLAVPAQTRLRFKQTENGNWIIYSQEDTWTLDGLIQSVPLVAWWYENVVRVVMGKIVSNAGSFLQTANQATTQLTTRAGEIGSKSREAFSEYQAQGYSLVKPYSARVGSFVGPIKDTTQQKAADSIAFAQGFVGPYITNALTDGRSKASALVSRFRGSHDAEVH